MTIATVAMIVLATMMIRSFVEEFSDHYDGLMPRPNACSMAWTATALRVSIGKLLA